MSHLSKMKRDACRKTSVIKWVIAAVVIAAISAKSASAFYDYNGDSISVDMRALLQLNATYYKNPDSQPISYSPDSSVVGPGARLLISAAAGEGVAFDFNGLFYGVHSSTPLIASRDAMRSGAFEWVLRDGPNQHNRFLIDQAFLRISNGAFDLRLGRQPVNYSTCFYFTPNDLFAPFSANAFYRKFKPGVDAARMDARLGDLSQFTVLHAIGYTPDPATANGWGRAQDASRSSTIIRFTAAAGGFEWGAMAGRAEGDDILGASLQGELFNWLGVRAEGHHRATATMDYYEISGGVEHKFPSSLFVRYEYFNHGSGSERPATYAVASPPGGYMGRQYGATGVGYEFSPLFNGQALHVQNYSDHSWMLSLYGVYSLADEADVSFGLTLPFGDAMGLSGPASEFGLYPSSANVEFRLYF